MTENTPLKDLAESVKVPAELVKAVGEPPAQELGQGLADLVYLIFSPVKKWRASTEANVEKYKEEIAKELHKIEPEKRTEPKLSVVGPALEESKYYIEEDELRRMFAKLIAASANSDYKDSTLPAFVEVIKQLSAFDAKNLKFLSESLEKGFPVASIYISDDEANFQYVQYFFPFLEVNLSNLKHYSASIDNLLRLNLIEIQFNRTYFSEDIYEILDSHEVILDLKAHADYHNVHEITEDDLKTLDPKLVDCMQSLNKPFQIDVEKGMWNLTTFGEFFIKCCVD